MAPFPFNIYILYVCYIYLYFSQDLATLPNDLNHGDNYLPHDDRLLTHRNSAGYSFDGLPKLSNASGGGTKSQASTASSSATRDSGISVTDAQRAADENRCTHYYVYMMYLYVFYKFLMIMRW